MPKARREVQFATLPWRRAGQGEVEVLLVTSRETRRWVLPKGWGKHGEAPRLAAAREAYEESGVEGKVALRALGHYGYLKLMKSGRVRAVRVAVHPLEVVREHAEWPEKDVREKLWASPSEAASLVAEPELQELLAGFVPQNGKGGRKAN